MTTRDKLIKFLYEYKIDSPYFNNIEELADVIINDNFFCNSETLKEQIPLIYHWTAVEDDGYTHSEAGIANNMLDAFIKATEYSPSYHKKVVIEKIQDDELTEEEKELKEFWTNEKSS